MIETGWIPEELPAGQVLRSVATILAEGPTLREERDQERRERAKADERQARAQDAADTVAAAQFRARVNGTPPRSEADVLADAGREPLGRQDAGRRRAAISILREHGLSDVITGGDSGCILDPNVGIIEPVRDERQRAAMDYQYACERSEREAAERRRAVDVYRARLDEQWRARGVGSSRTTQRSGDVPRHVSFRWASRGMTWPGRYPPMTRCSWPRAHPTSRASRSSRARMGRPCRTRTTDDHAGRDRGSHDRGHNW